MDTTLVAIVIRIASNLVPTIKGTEIPCSTLDYQTRARRLSSGTKASVSIHNEVG